MTFAVIFATTGMIQLSKALDLRYMFIIIGAVTLLSTIVIFFGMREHTERSD